MLARLTADGGSGIPDQEDLSPSVMLICFYAHHD
jgi:hypothetical protein